MQRPLGDRYLVLWGETFADNLPPAELGLTEAAAVELVAAAEQAAWQALRSFAAQTLLSESKAASLDLERDERGAKLRAAQHARTEAEARRAWRLLYGAELARKIEPYTTYAIVTRGELVLAVPADMVEAVVAAVREASGAFVDDSAKRASGVQLGTVAPRLDAVVQAPFEAAELIAAAVGREQQAAAARRGQQAEAARVARERSEQERTYGTRLPAE